MANTVLSPNFIIVSDAPLSFHSVECVFAISMSLTMSLSHNCILLLPVSDSFLHLPLQWHLLNLKWWKIRHYFFLSLDWNVSSEFVFDTWAVWGLWKNQRSALKWECLGPFVLWIWEFITHMKTLSCFLVVKAVMLQVGSPQGVSHEPVENEW